LIITRATEYAIRAVLYMASQPQGEIILKKDICRVQEITPAFLTKILQPLIKEGIVGSQRGVGGGFFLAKPAADITLFDVVKTQEGPLYLNQCLIDGNDCSREFFCPVHGVWQEIRTEFMATLSRYDFAALAARQATMPRPVPTAGKTRRKKSAAT
jgi:Rrf2 family protein